MMDLIKIRKELVDAEDKRAGAQRLIAEKGQIVFAHRTTSHLEYDLVIVIAEKGIYFPQVSQSALSDNEAMALRDALIKIYGNPENKTTDKHR